MKTEIGKTIIVSKELHSCTYASSVTDTGRKAHYRPVGLTLWSDGIFTPWLTNRVS